MRTTLTKRVDVGMLMAMVVAAAVATHAQNAEPRYNLVKKVVLGGEGGWDYFTADPVTHRIFIGRGSYVMVLDAEGNVIGKVEMGKENEAHAVALAPDLRRAFSSNGGGSSVSSFDPDGLKVLSEVKIADRDTDDIQYEPVTKRVFTFNGGKGGGDSTAIDAVKGAVLGNIPLGGKPETAQADGKGHLYVNIEDKSELSEIDAATLKVIHTWPLAPCKNPSGQAIDTAHSLLVIGCHNGMMAFWDCSKEKVVGSVPIPPGVDANRYDAGTELAFASTGSGTGAITVARRDASGEFHVVQTIVTMKGARTMALDTGNHNVYTVSSEFDPPPAPTAENPRPWPKMRPGTFTLMIYQLK